ncbi:restriction endonuclease subunit S [Curtobacterium citreum]|uniref:restriction endonuclease subunit S n=1 Tax=Curtobacterium citreum TaxID=2036 RepID=UPI0025508CA5|nr:restriction endonuclease subunit S [Curtobacterium citreum]MDK8171281.1 restriction endonuclease subunit S [Curtobacterium citreum]
MGELFKYPRVPDVEMVRVKAPNTTEDRAYLAKHDLLFARRSLTLEGAGKCAIVAEVNTPTTWESSIIRARIDGSKANAVYLYYYFRSPQGRLQMETIVEQVAAAGIRLTELAKLDVPTPPLQEQQAIAEVLGALDDKIAANTTLATTADELVRAEYAALEGDVVRIGDIAGSPRSGVNPTSVDPNGLYVGLEHLERRHMWLSRGGRAKDVSSSKSEFQAGDVLFGKLRPYFHKVVGAPEPGICSTDVLVVRARDERLSSVLLAGLSSDAVIEEVVARSEGTRMPRTNWKDLASVEIRWPRADRALLVASRLDSIGAAALAAVAENRTLARTRDTLLPHLISGKLRVSDAEAAASEAGA